MTHYIYFCDVPRVHSFDRFLPNGQVDLVIDLRDVPKNVSDNETLEPVQSVSRAWVSGVRTRAITIPSGAGAEHFIVQFRAGFSGRLFGFPLTEVTDRVVPSAEILPWINHELRSRLLEASAPSDKFVVADRVLARVLSHEPVHPVIEGTVPRLARDPRLWSVATLESLTGYTSRYVGDLFKRHLGLSPKAWFRLLRFQRALHMLGCGLTPSRTALDCGYYDQAHFTGDFGEFTGLTPTSYLERKGEDPYYLPVG